MSIFSKIILGSMIVLGLPLQSAYAWHPPFGFGYVVNENGLGEITGKIMGSLLPVTDAEVVLMLKDKIIDKTTTDEDGIYSFHYVRPGDYDIKATKQGYRITIIAKVPVSEDYVTVNDLYLAKFNNEHMPKNPFVESYRDNWKKYMRNK